MSEATSKSDGSAADDSQADVLVPALAKIKGNLELLLGKSVVVSSAAASMLPVDAVPPRIPGNGLVLGVQASGAVEGQIYCYADQTLLLAMTGLAQMKTPEAIAARLETGAELDDVERDGAREVGSFITAALGDFAKDSTGGRIVLAPLDPRFVPGDEPPSLAASQTWAIIEAGVEIAPAPLCVLVLAVPAAIVAAWQPPAPSTPFGKKPAGGEGGGAASPSRSSSPSTSRIVAEGTPTVWIAAGDGLLAAIRAAAGDTLVIEGLPSLAKLLAAAESGALAPALVLVEVPKGAEHQLELISALRHDPVLCGSVLMVALEVTSRRNVVRCGALGIVEVVPSDLDPSLIADRMASRSRPFASKSR